MKRISASAVKAACEMPAEEIVPTTAQEADSQRSSALPVSFSDQNAHFESGLAHLARLAALGEMLVGIVHEINQPLFAIQNYAHALTIDLTQRTPLDHKKLMASAGQIVAGNRSRQRDREPAAGFCPQNGPVCRSARRASARPRGH